MEQDCARSLGGETEAGDVTVMVVSAFLGGLAGVLAGGHIRNIARLRIRRWWLLLIALVIQATLSLVPIALRVPGVVVASALLIIWCASNLHVGRVVPGMVALGLGIFSNVLVIAVNGGMPVSLRALVDAGYPVHFNVTRGHLDKHVAPPVPHLGFLGDWIPIPGLRNILSLGDVVMLIGIFLIIRAATLNAPNDAAPDTPAARIEAFDSPAAGG
jgi:hypothetical protein